MRLLLDTHVVLWQLSGERELPQPAIEAAAHGLAVSDLPVHHRDPFDSLLIAQAQADSLTIVTADRRFGAYPVPLVDAS